MTLQSDEPGEQIGAQTPPEAVEMHRPRAVYRSGACKKSCHSAGLTFAGSTGTPGLMVEATVIFFM